MKKFDSQEFVERQVKEIRKVVGEERALIAVSGGVDSTTCAVLTHLALGKNLLCVMLDDAFMRDKEPEKVAQLLSSPPLKLPIKVLNVQKRFLNALNGLRDAEDKRKAFREAFYTTLSYVTEKEGYQFLVQGTIKPDILETERGIKTQHNVLSQIGISPIKRYNFRVIEPLVPLYKPQVRQVARHLKVPTEISERQPFPGPGLSVRVVGEITLDKLESLKKATAIAEEKLAKHQPEQYFAAIINYIEKPQHLLSESIRETAARFLNVSSKEVSVKVLRDRATGIRSGGRHYGEIALIKVQSNDNFYQPQIKNLIDLQHKILTETPSFTRILYTINEKPEKKPYIIVIRAIHTHDFMTARVAPIPWATLNEIAKETINECHKVSNICYDVTPKPPATIEME